MFLDSLEDTQTAAITHNKKHGSSDDDSDDSDDDASDNKGESYPTDKDNLDSAKEEMLEELITKQNGA